MEFENQETEADEDRQTILQIAAGLAQNDGVKDKENNLEEVDRANAQSSDECGKYGSLIHDNTSNKSVTSKDYQNDGIRSKDANACDCETTPSENIVDKSAFQEEFAHSDTSTSTHTKISLDNLKTLDGLSSNESSCLNSPLYVNFNGITVDSLSSSNINVNVLIKEYESLKANYENLQSDYKTSLEREKELCERLQEYGGQGDESCNSLANINNELRRELDNVLAELRTLRAENKKLQDTNSNGNNGEKRSLSHMEKVEDIVKLEKAVSELEQECKQFEEERNNAMEKLTAHDAAAKRAITALQKEMTVRVEQIAKSKEETIIEKDALLLKIVKIEEALRIEQKKHESLEKKIGDSRKEIDRLKAIGKQKDTDFSKLQTSVSEKEEEINRLKNEISKLKEDDSSQNMKVKWAQNKLKQELEAHKETKTKLSQANAKIEEAKEEGEQIRTACQEMIRKYQNSEEMRSIQLGKELKEKDSALKVHEHEIAVQDEIHRKRTQEMEALKAEHRKALGEISQLKTTVSMLEGKLSNYSIKTSEMEKRISVLSKKEEESVLTDKLLNDANQDLKGYKEQVTYYVELEERLRKQLLDVESEVTDCKQREAELLSYTEKLTENNAQWKSKAFDYQSRIETMEVEMVELKSAVQNSQSNKKDQDAALRKTREEYEEAMEEIAFQLEQKRKLVEELSLSLEEAQDEVKVQKRKNTSTIKDFQRQLQQSKKRIDQLEECLSNSQDGLPLKSRASSNSSLDRLSNDSGNQGPITTQVNGGNTTTISNPAIRTSQSYNNYNGEYSIVQPRQTRGHTGEIEVDKAMLVDRICRLQKAHAKKNEKIEFLEEHNRSLVDDIKKKNKVVQFYVMREEAGTLVPNRFDKNKAEITRKGGIMASVYSSRVSDKDMTLDLSLEINRKLQSVLEDTLLKNITLKESISTLGSEIARLQEDVKRSRKT